MIIPNLVMTIGFEFNPFALRIISCQLVRHKIKIEHKGKGKSVPESAHYAMKA
jgi:hypothetical protein